MVIFCSVHHYYAVSDGMYALLLNKHNVLWFIFRCFGSLNLTFRGNCVCSGAQVGNAAACVDWTGTVWHGGNRVSSLRGHCPRLTPALGRPPSPQSSSLGSMPPLVGQAGGERNTEREYQRSSPSVLIRPSTSLHAYSVFFCLDTLPVRAGTRGIRIVYYAAVKRYQLQLQYMRRLVKSISHYTDFPTSIPIKLKVRKTISPSLRAFLCLILIHFVLK